MTLQPQTGLSALPFVHNPAFDRVWLAIHAWESHKAGTSEAQKVEEEIQRLIDSAIATEYLDSGRF